MMQMFEKTGCDAVMVGRAAQGNPWFFKEAIAALKGKPKPEPPSLNDIATTCSRHFDLLLKNRGEKTGSNMMRKHFSNYIKGFPGASNFRQRLVTAPDLDSMRDALNMFIDASMNIHHESA